MLWSVIFKISLWCSWKFSGVNFLCEKIRIARYEIRFWRFQFLFLFSMFSLTDLCKCYISIQNAIDHALNIYDNVDPKYTHIMFTKALVITFRKFQLSIQHILIILCFSLEQSVKALLLWEISFFIEDKMWASQGFSVLSWFLSIVSYTCFLK